MSLNFRAILLAMVSLVIVGCSDTVRSPDLPAEQLVSIGAVTCTPDSLAVGERGVCTINGQCIFRRFDSDGNFSLVREACPDDVTFVSSNPDIVLVGSSGDFIAVSEGQVTINAQGGGQSSEGDVVTVNPACAVGLELTPEDARLVAGQSQPYQAIVRFTDGEELNVTSQASFTSSDDAVATFNGNPAGVLQSSPDVADVTTLTINASANFTGNACPGAVFEDSTSVVIEPAQLLVDGVCIETVPPSVPFGAARCRERDVAAACDASTLRLNLTNPAEVVQLALVGRFNNGLECDISDEATIEIDPAGIATLDTDNLTIAAAAPGDATLTAEFAGQTSTRPVEVVVAQVFASNSLAVSSSASSTGFTDASRFACIGANDILSGLAGNGIRGQLLAFAKARPCPANDVEMVDGRLVCTAPGLSGAEGRNAFNQLPFTLNVTNQMSRSADPLDDGIIWSAQPGVWDGFGCAEPEPSAGGGSPALVGDVFFPEPRTLVAGRGLNALNQPNGVVFADNAVRLGFSCVTATFENPEDPAETVTDGLTVLVLPIVNDDLLSDSSNDGQTAEQRLCDSLGPLFGNPLLGVIPVTDILNPLTGGINFIFENLDALPLDFILSTVLDGFNPDTFATLPGAEFVPDEVIDALGQFPGLSFLTADIVSALDEALINPVVAPVACELTAVVNLLLGIGTGTPPNQQCPDSIVPLSSQEAVAGDAP